MLWSKQLSVGNSIVDSEHKHLIALTNGVGQAMKTAMHSRDGLPLKLAFDQLEQELCRHFLSEEQIVVALGLPQEPRRQAQQHMLGDLRFLKAELMAKDCLWTEAALRHFSNFLEDLIAEHITLKDMPMKAALLAYDYDFWPAPEKPSVAPWHGAMATIPAAAYAAA
jgi:hemerythrin-like metal-binding protein